MTQSSRKLAWYRKARRIILRDAVIALLLLAVAEIALRRWAPGYRRNVYDSQFTGARPMEFNRAGYRGRLPKQGPGPNEERILALGDSVTFGTGLGVDETWPQQLATLLNEGTSQTSTVINGGMPATDLNQLRLAYESQWSAYSPRVVVLVATGNMVSLAWIRRSQIPHLPENGYLAELPSSSLKSWTASIRRAVSGLAISGFVSIQCRTLLYATGVINHELSPDEPYGVMLAFGWKQGNLDKQRTEIAWSLFETSLQKLDQSVRSRGARLIVTFAPPRFSISDSTSDNLQFVPRDRFTIDPFSHFADICHRNAISCGDALESLRMARKTTLKLHGRSDSMYVPGDYTHFDAEGSRVIAQLIHSMLHDSNRLSQGRRPYQFSYSMGIVGL